MNDDIERMIAEVIDAEDLPQPPAVSAPLTTAVSTPQSKLFQDEEMLGLCAEVISNMRNDRKQLDSILCNFVEMVFNEGDSTTASKEALVNLMKAKTDMSDKMMKIIELMGKFKLKEIADAPKSVTASQENHYHFGSRRSLLERIENMQKKKSLKKTPEEKKDA